MVVGAGDAEVQVEHQVELVAVVRELQPEQVAWIGGAGVDPLGGGGCAGERAVAECLLSHFPEAVALGDNGYSGLWLTRLFGRRGGRLW